PLASETGGLIMQHLFAVPWLTPSRRTLHGIAVVAILGFGFFAILKSTSGGREAPAKELVTGSIPRAVSVPKPRPTDPMGRFPQSSLNPTYHARTKHGGGSTRRSVAAPATKTAMTLD